MKGKPPRCRRHRSFRTSQFGVSSASIFAALLTMAFVFGLAAASSALTPRTSFVSAIGYGNQTSSPLFLIGAELLASRREGSLFTGIKEDYVALHLSDAISFDGQTHVVATGVKGHMRRTKGPVYTMLEANYHLRRHDFDWTKSMGVGGSLATGRVVGSIRFDYIESAEAHFPWFQKDLHGIAPKGDDEPFYRAQFGVSATVVPAIGLSWSQDLRWRKNVNGDRSHFTLTTGPEFIVGEGRLAAQGGVFINADETKPFGVIRYDYRPIGSRTEFQINVASDSLEGNGPLMYGWMAIDGDEVKYAIGMRLEKSSDNSFDPAWYFSIQPKL